MNDKKNTVESAQALIQTLQEAQKDCFSFERCNQIQQLKQTIKELRAALYLDCFAR